MVMNAETSNRKREERAGEARRTTAPVVDIYENKEEVLLIADLPGVSPDDLSIQFDKDELLIAGRRAKAPEGSKLAAEFAKHDFERRVVVPQGILADGISAEMAHGV